MKINPSKKRNSSLFFPSGKSIKQAKKDAKRLAKSSNIPLNKAQDLIAKENGINKYWHKAIKYLIPILEVKPLNVDITTNTNQVRTNSVPQIDKVKGQKLPKDMSESLKWMEKAGLGKNLNFGETISINISNPEEIMADNPPNKKNCLCKTKSFLWNSDKILEICPNILISSEKLGGNLVSKDQVDFNLINKDQAIKLLLDGFILKDLPNWCLSDLDIMMSAVEYDAPSAISYISPELKKDKSLAIKCIKSNIISFECLPAELQQDQDILNLINSLEIEDILFQLKDRKNWYGASSFGSTYCLFHIENWILPKNIILEKAITKILSIYVNNLKKGKPLDLSFSVGGFYKSKTAMNFVKNCGNGYLDEIIKEYDFFYDGEISAYARKFNLL